MVCTQCSTKVTILAHQIRNGQMFDVCLDCADRYYQNQLTRNLIAAEKNAVLS